MRRNADNNRSTVMWTKSMDDESSTASLSSAHKPSEISLIPSTSDSVNGETSHDSLSLAASKVYQTNEQRPSSCRSNEPRRSKSRVRTYLKRCKDAIIGAQTQSDTIGAQHDQSISNASLDEIRPTAKSSTSSWYVNELFSNSNRNEVNESSSAMATTMTTATISNANLTRNCGEIEYVVAAEETPALVEEISIQSTAEMVENTFAFVVSVFQFYDRAVYYLFTRAVVQQTQHNTQIAKQNLDCER